MPPLPAIELVGRDDELDQLAGLVNDLAKGRGSAVLVEGEPGIGKSALLATGLRSVVDSNAEVCWAVADELGQRSPLRVMLDCFGIDVRSPDPRRAEIASLLRDPDTRTPRVLGMADTVAATAERLLALVDQLCADLPLVVVVDDLQWADELSLMVWHRLAQAVEQLPLLLGGAYRTVPRRTDLTTLRRSVRRRGGLILHPGPLSPAQVDTAVSRLVGARPGPALREMAAQTGGNPMYLLELIAAFRREDAISVDGSIAELRSRREPVSLAGAIKGRLNFLTSETIRILQMASLLGPEFSVIDLATVVGTAPTAIVPTVQEAQASGIVVESGMRLAFRHPLLREALYKGMPRAVRTGLHRHVAEALAAVGAATEDIAVHLLACEVTDGWALHWLTESLPALARRAPRLAATLLERAVERINRDDPRWETFGMTLAVILFLYSRNLPARTWASDVLQHTKDPQVAAEMRWILTYVALRLGRADEVLTTLRTATADSQMPDVWRARLLALAAVLLVRGLGEVERAEVAGGQALELGQAVQDGLAIASALHCLSVVSLVRRDAIGALERTDRALAALGDDESTAAAGIYVRLLLLGNQMYALVLLDRLAQAEEVIRSARIIEERSGNPRPTTSHLMACSVAYLTGRWDDARAELDAIADLLDGSYTRLIWYGLGALLAVRRDDQTAARSHLQAVAETPIVSANDRTFSDYLIVARSLAAARRGDPRLAVTILSVLIDPEYDLVLRRFEWLPILVRLALEADDRDTAVAATATSRAEADRHGTAASAAAADRCAALLSHDPAPLRKVTEYYRRVGRICALAESLEDLAIALAKTGEGTAAHAALTEAIELYQAFGANWDVRRAAARARGVGVRLGSRGPRRRPARGWASLTPTERRIAELVAQGKSNPDIAADLMLSRRTVQSHVSHILTKLNARSRVGIAREVTLIASVDEAVHLAAPLPARTTGPSSWG